MTGIEIPAAVAQRLEAPLGGHGEGGIGFVGPDVPIEVLLASGRAFGHLPWSPDAATPWADRWLESSFPFWARSILERWHAGDFDALASVVFSRADDAAQRLYYYVAELQRRGRLAGPVPEIFDIALVRRDSSLGHTADAIGKLCRVLATQPAALERAIVRANTLRGRLAEIQASRHGHGPVFERLARAALWSDPTQWLYDLEIPQHAASRARVLLSGSVPPDDRVHAAVEAAGASVVAEAHAFGLGRLGSAVSVGSDGPELALAARLHAASIGPRAGIDRAAWVLEQARTAQADAVIIWLTREDEALAWQVPAQRAALAAAGMPALVLPAASWELDAQNRDRIFEFSTGLVHAAS